MEVKITVIIAVYNTEKFIERCIDSVLNQTLQEFEIVIIDDDSSDHSIEVISKYCTDPRVVLIEKEQNEGLMESRKSGYRISKGEYIIFVDSDDYLPENALEVLYKAACENEADVVVGNTAYIPVKGENMIAVNYIPGGTTSKQAYEALLYNHLKHNLWGKIYRKELFDRYTYSSYMNQNHGEDMILFYQLIGNARKIICISEVVYYYCQNTTSLTQKRMSDTTLKQWLFAAQWWFDFCSQQGFEQEMIVKKVLKNARYLLQQNYNTKMIFNQFHCLSDLTKWNRLKKYTSKAEAFHLYLLIHSYGYRRLIYLFSLLKKILS